MFLPASRFLVAALLLPAACVGSDDVKKMSGAFQASANRPDELPVMQNKELPFRYPAALYAKKVQGNVTLRIHIDSNGQVIGDSTRVEETSGYPQLDSSAVKGAEELRFIPAKLRGEPVEVSILFPVYFRHPEGTALPGDTILHPRPAAEKP
jgi:TonB family protein